MTDQTVPSLTDRLAAYMVEAFLDGRGYDPGDIVDVEVTIKDGFSEVLADMREDQEAGTATYDGFVSLDAERLKMTPVEYVALLRGKQRSLDA